mmetsp:Transcript_85147/g.194204  ORF Transcript_85147/g.194204 Transcript_85147/m.194204 type:complete len:730 (-) Transcript_85147:11-2200(-)
MTAHKRREFWQRSGSVVGHDESPPQAVYIVSREWPELCGCYRLCPFESRSGLPVWKLVSAPHGLSRDVYLFSSLDRWVVGHESEQHRTTFGQLRSALPHAKQRPGHPSLLAWQAAKGDSWQLELSACVSTSPEDLFWNGLRSVAEDRRLLVRGPFRVATSTTLVTVHVELWWPVGAIPATCISPALLRFALLTKLPLSGPVLRKLGLATHLVAVSEFDRLRQVFERAQHVAELETALNSVTDLSSDAEAAQFLDRVDRVFGSEAWKDVLEACRADEWTEVEECLQRWPDEEGARQFRQIAKMYGLPNTMTPRTSGTADAAVAKQSIFAGLPGFDSVTATLSPRRLTPGFRSLALTPRGAHEVWQALMSTTQDAGQGHWVELPSGTCSCEAFYMASRTLDARVQSQSGSVWATSIYAAVIRARRSSTSIRATRSGDALARFPRRVAELAADGSQPHGQQRHLPVPLTLRALRGATVLTATSSPASKVDRQSLREPARMHAQTLGWGRQSFGSADMLVSRHPATAVSFRVVSAPTNFWIGLTRSPELGPERWEIALSVAPDAAIDTHPDHHPAPAIDTPRSRTTVSIEDTEDWEFKLFAKSSCNFAGATASGFSMSECRCEVGEVVQVEVLQQGATMRCTWKVQDAILGEVAVPQEQVEGSLHAVVWGDFSFDLENIVSDGTGGDDSSNQASDSGAARATVLAERREELESALRLARREVEALSSRATGGP